MATRRARRRREEKRKIRSMILFVQWFFIILFSAMCIYIFTYAMRYKESLFENDYNGRQELILAENQRGRILTKDGEVLAETILDTAGQESRNYPFKNLFSHVVGYVSHGRSGIESTQHYMLSHSNLDLSEKAEQDAKGEKYSGNTVVTTLDITLQRAASGALEGEKGAVIVTNPKNGAILALVSKPDFDPNTLDANWDKYLNAAKDEGVLLNRATQGQYPPGSTFKIFDTIEYIQEHPDDWQNYSYACSGSVTIDGETVHCYHWNQHGNVDLRRSFAKSCNSSYANLGMMLNKKAYANFLDKLLFEKELPFDYPTSVSHVYIEEQMPAKEMIQLAIGQGENYMSPFHLNLLTQAVANRGVLMKPRLVESAQTASGKLIASYKPSEYRRMFSENAALVVTDMMEAVVSEGTASKLKETDYRPCGKTGSAEYNKNDETLSHAWFTGFAPADDPEICVTVIVEGAGSGGESAVPVAKKIFDTYFGISY